MGILKNMTLKAVAKKHTRLLTDFIETNPVYNKDGATDLSETIKAYLLTLESLAEGGLSIRLDAVSNWNELFLAVVWQCVRIELSYDPAMGSDADLELTHRVVSKELNKWKRRLEQPTDLENLADEIIYESELQDGEHVSTVDNNQKQEIEDLSLLRKKGVCLFIQGWFVTFEIFQSLGKAIQKHTELPVDKIHRLRNEIACYVFYEIMLTLWELEEETITNIESEKTLDMLTNYFLQMFFLDILPENLDEYQDAENPLELAAKHIRMIFDCENLVELEHTAITISAELQYTLFPGVRRMLNLTEGEMDALIIDFFVNYYPQYYKN